MSHPGPGARGVRPAAALLLVMAAAFALASLLTAPAQATTANAASPATSVASAAPADASISILLVSLSGLDLTSGTFDATFYLGISCPQECDPSGWDIINERTISSELTTKGDGQWWWRVQGSFVFQPDRQMFPFDTQHLPIMIEHKRLDASAFVYVPNLQGSEVSSDVAVPGWTVEPFTFTSRTSGYASLGSSYSRATFTVPVERSTLASITKYYIPLMVFILLGVATLVLDRSDYQIRTAGTALVGLTVFYLATSDGVGTVGYLTLWDVSVLLGYLVLGLVLICGVIGGYNFHEGAYEGPEGPARSKRMRFRFLGAIVVVLILATVGITLTAVLS